MKRKNIFQSLWQLPFFKRHKKNLKKFFKKPQNIWVTAFSILILGFGLLYTNCGVQNNLTNPSAQNASKNSILSAFNKEGFNGEDFKPTEDAKVHNGIFEDNDCEDIKVCGEKMNEVVKPYVSNLEEAEKNTKLIPIDDPKSDQPLLLAQAIHQQNAAFSPGDVYVVDQGNNRVQVFDNSGNYILQWGNFGIGNNQFSWFGTGTWWPQGVATDSSGNVYVADGPSNRVQKFDNNGNFILSFGWGVQNGASQFQTCTTGCQALSAMPGNNFYFAATYIAVDPAGNIYVTDEANYRVVKFDSNGNYLSQWGSMGGGPGQFWILYGIAADSIGNVYIADYGSHRIQKFDSNGNFILTFGWGVQNGANQFQICTTGCHAGFGNGGGNGQFDNPINVAIDSMDNLYVVDYSNSGPGRIQKFDSNGNYLLQWGITGLNQPRPIGIAIDPSDNIYIGINDYSYTNIQKFDSNGNYLLQWGSLGSGNSQFNNPLGPCGIAIGNATPQADLVVSAITAPATIPVGSILDAGDPYAQIFQINFQPPVPVDITIKNIGNADAVIPANMYVDLFISCTGYAPCNQPYGGGSGFKTIPIGTAMTLHPGDTYVVSTDSLFAYNIPYSGSTTYTGIFNLSAFVDGFDHPGPGLTMNLVTESNETNNYRTPVLPVTVVP